MIYFVFGVAWIFVLFLFGIAIRYIRDLEDKLVALAKQVSSLKRSGTGTIYGSLAQPPPTPVYRALFLVDPSKPPMAS